VCDLAAALDVAQPSISRHLAYLRQANLINSRKDGLWSYYQIREATSPLQILVTASLEAVAAELPEAKADAKRLRETQADCCN